MKKSWIIIPMLICAFSVQSKAQFSFGVSPGLNLNSAYFGYKLDKFVPFLGLQFASAHLQMNETGSINGPTSYDVKGNIFMPSLGVKYFAFESGQVQGYALLSVSKPFVSAKSTTDGQPDTEFNDAANNFHAFGGQVGFGAEYFFSDNFSLGGEFGLMLLHSKYEDSYQESNGSSTPNTVTQTTKVGINPTYSKISLNFYF